MRYAPTRVRSFDSLHVPGQIRRRPQMPVCDTPLPGYQAIHVPGQIRRRPQTPPAKLPCPGRGFSALFSGSIFATVFGDAKSDGPVRDVKRESSERLEQCPLL